MHCSDARHLGLLNMHSEVTQDKRATVDVELEAQLARRTIITVQNGERGESTQWYKVCRVAIKLRCSYSCYHSVNGGCENCITVYDNI
jgi:hypothetical protein